MFLSPLFWLAFILPGTIPDQFSLSRCGSGSGQIMRIRTHNIVEKGVSVPGTVFLLQEIPTSSRINSP